MVRERWIQRGRRGVGGWEMVRRAFVRSPRRRGHTRNKVGKITGRKFPYTDEKRQTIESKTLKTANRSLYIRRKETPSSAFCKLLKTKDDHFGAPRGGTFKVRRPQLPFNQGVGARVGGVFSKCLRRTLANFSVSCEVILQKQKPIKDVFGQTRCLQCVSDMDT